MRSLAAPRNQTRPSRVIRLMPSIAIRPSRSITLALIAVHAVAAATLWPLALPVATRVAFAALVLASLCRAVRRYGLLRARGSVVELEVGPQDTARLKTRDGEWHEAHILGTTYVTPVLTVVNARKAGARFASHALIVADNTDPNDFRRLRVHLRWAYPRSKGQSESTAFDTSAPQRN